MGRRSLVASLVLLAVAVTGCRSSHRVRRQRIAPPPTPIEAELERPRPAPRPVETPPRPTPVTRPQPRPPDRLACGPAGKGPRFAVHGVDPADTLNVRVSPDARSDVLGQLLPNTTGVIALGDQQKVGASTWRKVKCGALVGWVNDRFLDPQENADKKPVTAKRM